jgi:hypothetical protein
LLHTEFQVDNPDGEIFNQQTTNWLPKSLDTVSPWKTTEWTLHAIAMMYTPARDVSSPPSTTTPNVRTTSGPPSSTLPDNGTGIESTPFIDYIDRKGGTDRQLPSPNTLAYQPQSSRKYVRWGIAWKPPSLMIGFAFLGFLSAIGHHLYYRALDGHAVGSPTRQQWAFRFGTAFSFLVIALLKAANNAAYSQYVWTLVRKRSFSIATLDKLFS